MNFKKTYWMNVVGAIGWVGFYVALTFDLTEVIWKTLVCGYLVAIPSLTAYVIKTNNQQIIYQLTKYLNYSLLIALVIEVATVIYAVETSPQPIFGAFIYVLIFALQLIIFVIPSIINIRSLNAIGN